MKYRVVYTVGYIDIWYDFLSAEGAILFAQNLLEHNVPNDDTKERKIKVSIELISPEILKEAEHDGE